jgi:hypothetical protein
MFGAEYATSWAEVSADEVWFIDIVIGRIDLCGVHREKEGQLFVVVAY